METHLCFTSTDYPINGSEQEKLCFVKNVNNSAGQMCIIYIRSADNLDSHILVSVAKVVNEMVSNFLGDMALYLIPIMQCSENDISRELDRLYIRQDQSSTITSRRLNPLPILGNEIQPPELIIMQQTGNYEYTAEEYVAWVAAGCTTYKYGKVIKLVAANQYKVEISPGQYTTMTSDKMKFFGRSY